MVGWICDDGAGAVVYAVRQVLLLFGESEKALRIAREAAACAGCRVAGEASLAEASARLDSQIAADGALVLAEAPSDALDDLLDHLAGEGESRGTRALVVAPVSMIDAVTAPGFSRTVDYLINPQPEEHASALTLLRPPPQSQLHDIGRRNGGIVLQQLSEEAARIASVLASLSENDRPVPAVESEAEPPAIDPTLVRGIIRARRLRDQFFRGEMFGDPAFDMLLDLYAARLEGERVAVSSLCIAAAVPATTALRWIKALTEKGLFVRSADPQDGRRVYIALSDDAAKAMGLYLAAVRRANLTLI